MNTSLTTNWTIVFNSTLDTCMQDECYPNYSARERMLAFVFTLLQYLKEDETHFLPIILNQKFPFLTNKDMIELKEHFYKYSDVLIFDATNTGEIQARPIIANYYQQTIWNALLAILYFWANDKSEYKENTDVMVEKTIHFTFDLLAPNPIDSGIDLVRHFLKLRIPNL